MKYKLVALDIDGTLLNSSHKITRRVHAAISEACAKGATVVLCTGRPFVSAKPFNEQLGISTPIMANSGAEVVDPVTGELLISSRISESVARSLIEVLRSYHCTHMIFDDTEDMLIERPDAITELFSTKLTMTTRKIDDFLELPKIDTPKIYAADFQHRLETIAAEMHERFPGEVTASLSLPCLLEIYNGVTTKGRALEELARSMGVEREEVIAVGDSVLDQSMIEYAGLGVAMGNSMPEILDSADVIAPGHDEDGVAWVLEKYVLGGS